MPDISHDEVKRLHEAYRKRAIVLLNDYDARHALDLKISSHIHIMDDGAFVECMLWVPREQLP